MFLYPALAAGFALLAVPPIVHLINLLRHRRQRWAAMDFLMASYRRQRRWIRLKQFLLLLCRVAAMGLLAAMLAGWTGTAAVTAIVGGGTHHHVVVLDDSVSMGASVGNADSYTRALGVIEHLVRRAETDDHVDQLTVIRGSRAALALSAGGASADSAADVMVGTVTAGESLITPLMATSVSPLSVSPAAAVDMAVAIADRTPADETHVYVLSDFRRGDWETPDRIAESLAKLAAGTDLRLVDCAQESSGTGANRQLAVTEVAPEPDVWVAGVPVVMRTTIRNFGATDATGVTPQVKVIRYEATGDNSAVDPTSVVSGTSESVPMSTIDRIAAGGEITRTFQVFVSQPGTHAVRVSLPPDSLAADNSRVCTLPLTDAEKVLIIDGTAAGRGAFALSSVLDPGSQVRIGAIPEVRPPAFLRDATAEVLSSYRAVYLTDLDSVPAAAADALAEYVRRGGGVAMFIGDNAVAAGYQSVAAAGLLPSPLDTLVPLEPTTDPDASDLNLADAKSTLTDPIRAVGGGALSLVTLAESWRLQPESQDNAAEFRTLIDRRDGLPLVQSTDLGAGRLVVTLAGLSGSQTNWSGDPTFVVFLLQSNAALYSGAAPSTHRLVTDQLVVAPESGEGSVPVTSAIYYRPVDSPPRSGIEVAATADGPPSVDPAGVLIDAGGSLDDFLAAGLGEWSYVDGEGGVVRPMASVIDPSDGDLSPVDPAAVLQSLPGVDASWVTAAVWSEQNSRRSGSTLTLVLLGLMAALLAVEQMLGYWASYHARPLTGRAAMTRSNATAGAAA